MTDNPRSTAAALVAQILATMNARRWTLAVAESLTGGALASVIVAVPGASAVFRGGVVAYDTSVKASLLGVNADLLAERGAVDGDVARLMAVGVRRALAAGDRSVDVGVATTGVAGPGAAEGKPAGTVFVAVSLDAKQVSRALTLAGSREEIRAQSVLAALQLLSECLRE